MVDLNFGIQQKFLQPSFLIKVITGIFTFATLIYMFVLDTLLYDYVWRKCGIKNGDLAAATTSFFIIAIILTVVLYFPSIVARIPFIGNNKLFQVIIAGSVAALTFILALSYGIKYNSSKAEYDYRLKFILYWESHEGDEKYKEWKKKYQDNDKADGYFFAHTQTSAQNVLGLFITLAILDAVLLFYFYKSDETDMGIANIAEPINSDSQSVPSYG